jgi:hypothetical protein
VLPTVATAVLLLLQDPPGVRSDSEVVKPEHMADAPEIASGTGFTVTMVVAVQPVPSE